MSNILIIKHGSLGDLIQASGAMKDIKKFYSNRKVFLLTTQPYSIFMSECPYLDGVLIDKRLPRWNLFYLNNLKKTYNDCVEMVAKVDSIILTLLDFKEKTNETVRNKNQNQNQVRLMVGKVGSSFEV